MDESKLELKVGAFAFVALAIAGALVFVLAGVGRGGGHVVNVDFGYGGGVEKGALVRIAGVKVGRVSAVEFRPNTKDSKGRATPVRYVCEIDAEMATALRSDAQASIGQQGALGESYVELDPGVGEAVLGSGATIRGIDPPRLDVVLARLADTFQAASDENGFKRFLLGVAEFVETINDVFSRHRTGISAIMKDVSLVVADAQGAVRDVRKITRTADALVSGDDLQSLLRDAASAAKFAKTELPALAKDARALIAELDQVAKVAGKLGPEDVAKLKQTLERFDRIAKEVEAVTANVDSIVGKIERGDGTMGQLVKDPKVYEDLRALLADLKAHPWKFIWKE